MVVRRPRRDELVRVAALEAECFSHPWTQEGFAQAYADDNVIFLVAADAQVIGYVLLYTAADQGEIPTIAVDRGRRGEGVGSALLAALFEEAGRRGVTRVFLEVRQGNLAAKALYRANAFVLVGVRRDFYQDPLEDADLMMRDLI